MQRVIKNKRWNMSRTVAVVGLALMWAGAATAETKVERMYVQNGKLVMEVVERPASSATVEVEIEGKSVDVAVQGLRPNSKKTVRTDIAVPCGSSTVTARTSDSGPSKTETLSNNCSGGGGSSSGSSGGSRSGVITIEDLSVGRSNGLLQARVKVRAQLGRATVKLRFEYDGQSEEVRQGGFSPNLARALNGRQPFPCNTTAAVTATIIEPQQYAGDSLTRELTRRCVGGSGTPNLVVTSLKRNDRGVSTAIADTSIKVRVVVENDSDFRMNDNEQGGNWWRIAIPGMTRGSHQVRRALAAHEQYSFNTNMSVPCYSRPEDKERQVTVTVDSANNILESNENDNKSTFTVEAKRCRDAG